MNDIPSEFLPVWAKQYFLRNKQNFDHPEKLAHRRNAFYRLFCTNNDGMRCVWEYADKIIVIDMEAKPLPEDGSWFMADLIYGTDNVIKDELIPIYQYPKALECPERHRLSPEQSAAKKVAKLLQALFHVTPRDCHASTINRYFGDTVEWLVIKFQIKLGPFDYKAMHRVYSLEYTTSSKRGWVQHRRAHDVIRRKTIAAIRRLAQISSDPSHSLIVRLQGIADELGAYPDMEDEHGHQIDLVSNKAGWHDWLRYVYNEMLDAIEWGVARKNLENAQWATLAETLFPDELEESISERRIGQIVQEVEKTWPERRQREREIALAEYAKLKAARERSI